MTKIINEVGKTYGKLTIIGQKGTGANKIFTCRCYCLNKTTFEARSINVKRGLTKSCGCLLKTVLAKRNIKHGAAMRKNIRPMYSKWEGAKHRYRDLEDKDYGGRGIEMCEEWVNDYPAFEKYMLSLLNCPKNILIPGAKLDREIDRYPDNDGNYEPGNVRWATRKEQASNRRSNRFVIIKNSKGTIRVTLKQAAKRYNISYIVVHSRLTQGWNLKDALTKPVRSIYNREEQRKAIQKQVDNVKDYDKTVSTKIPRNTVRTVRVQ